MSYSFLNGFTHNSGGTTYTATGLSIPAGFCVVVLYLEKATATTATVTVGATGLTQDTNSFSSGNYLYASYSGTITSSTQVAITGAISFGDISFGLWYWTGSGSISAHTSGNESTSIAVTNGDYMFGVTSAANFTGSSVAPSNLGPGTYSVSGADTALLFADWAIASTNPSFAVDCSTFSFIFAVDYTPSGGGGGGGGPTSIAVPRKMFLQPKKKFYLR